VHKKDKGSIAEMAVATKLMKLGWTVLHPLSENNRYDLVAERGNEFKRIQVKYVTPKNGGLPVNCRSSNNWSVKRYSPKEVDIIAAYDSRDENIYFIPSSIFNASTIKLRLEPTKNGQRQKIRHAKEFINLN